MMSYVSNRAPLKPDYHARIPRIPGEIPHILTDPKNGHSNGIHVSIVHDTDKMCKFNMTC